MSANPFDTPAPPGSGITWQELLGALIMVEPVAQETGIKTAYGDADAVRADVVVLDGPEPGRQYLDTLVFPKVLAGQLSRSIGKKVLGRVGQGTAKPGQSPPWMLLEASEADVAVGQAYLASRAPQSAQPAPAAAPPQQWAPQQGAQVPF